MSHATMLEAKADSMSEAEYVGAHHICTQVPKPTFKELLKCVMSGTWDGVLESALHLPPDQYEVLEGHVKAAKTHALANRGKTRRRRS